MTPVRQSGESTNVHLNRLKILIKIEETDDYFAIPLSNSDSISRSISGARWETRHSDRSKTACQAMKRSDSPRLQRTDLRQNCFAFANTKPIALHSLSDVNEPLCFENTDALPRARRILDMHIKIPARLTCNVRQLE